MSSSSDDDEDFVDSEEVVVRVSQKRRRRKKKSRHARFLSTADLPVEHSNEVNDKQAYIVQPQTNRDCSMGMCDQQNIITPNILTNQQNQQNKTNYPQIQQQQQTYQNNFQQNQFSNHNTSPNNISYAKNQFSPPCFMFCNTNMELPNLQTTNWRNVPVMCPIYQRKKF